MVVIYVFGMYILNSTRELVDYVEMVQTRILKQEPYNFTTKAPLSAKAFSLSAFMTSKIPIVTQKPRRRQLKTKVCSIAKVYIYLF